MVSEYDSVEASVTLSDRSPSVPPTMYRSVLIALSILGLVSSQAPPEPAPVQPAKPKIDWGSCPELEPTEALLKSKSNVLQNCLKDFPVPTVFEAPVVAERKSHLCKLRNKV